MLGEGREGSGLERARSRFARADSDRLLERADEDLSVANVSCFGSFFDGVDRAFHLVFAEGDLDLYLRKEVDYVFGAAIQLTVALLPAESTCLDDRQALDADLRKGLSHLVEFVRLNNRRH